MIIKIESRKDSGLCGYLFFLEHEREDTLHYRVVEHIKKEYPDAVMHAGLGEHLTTKHAGLDAKLKGYTKGEPDITVIRQLPNRFQDVLAIELKNPNGKGVLDDGQKNTTSF